MLYYNTDQKLTSGKVCVSNETKAMLLQRYQQRFKINLKIKHPQLN